MDSMPVGDLGLPKGGATNCTGRSANLLFWPIFPQTA